MQEVILRIRISDTCEKQLPRASIAWLSEAVYDGLSRQFLLGTQEESVDDLQVVDLLYNPITNFDGSPETIDYIADSLVMYANDKLFEANHGQEFDEYGVIYVLYAALLSQCDVDESANPPK